MNTKQQILKLLVEGYKPKIVEIDDESTAGIYTPINEDVADLIYTEIVEPLEKELKKFDENVLRQIVAQNCILNEENAELKHKAEVLERALEGACDQVWGAYMEDFIEQAEKEIDND